MDVEFGFIDLEVSSIDVGFEVWTWNFDPQTLILQAWTKHGRRVLIHRPGAFRHGRELWSSNLDPSSTDLELIWVFPFPSSAVYTSNLGGNGRSTKRIVIINNLTYAFPVWFKLVSLKWNNETIVCHLDPRANWDVPGIESRWTWAIPWHSGDDLISTCVSLLISALISAFPL